MQLAEALLADAEGSCEHALSDLSVANQRSALSTLAISRLLDAMASRTVIVRLGLGNLRDDGARKRHQQVTMANTEAKRVRRQQQQQQQSADGDGTGGGGGTGGGSGTPLVRRSSASSGALPSGEGGGSARKLSSGLLERVASIEKTEKARGGAAASKARIAAAAMARLRASHSWRFQSDTTVTKVPWAAPVASSAASMRMPRPWAACLVLAWKATGSSSCRSCTETRPASRAARV